MCTLNLLLTRSTPERLVQFLSFFPFAVINAHAVILANFTYLAFIACSLKYISLLPVKRNWMYPVGPRAVGQSVALKLIFHKPLPLWGGRSAKSPKKIKK